MKKYLLGLFAVALAVGFSAFTMSPKASFDGKWYRFSGGSEIVAGNYQQAEEVPVACPSDEVLCKIFVEDLNNDGILDQDELDAALDVLDPDHDGDISEHLERPGIADFKAEE